MPQSQASEKIVVSAGSILDLIPMGILIIDEETHRIIYANDAALQMIGVDRESVTGKVCHNFICPNDVGRCPITDLGLEVDNSERLLVRANGEKVPILKTVKKIFWEGRACLVESFIDITELRKAKNALQQERNLLELATSSMNVGLAVLSKDFRILWANNILRKIRDNIIGEYCYSVFANRNEVCPWCPARKVLEEGVPEATADYMVSSDGNEEKWVQLYANALRDENGNILYAVEIAVPITERKKLEKELKRYSENLEELVQKRTKDLLESEKRYSLLVNEVSAGVVTIQDEKVVFVNKTLLNLLGYSEDEVIGHPYEKFVDEKYRQKARELYLMKLQGSPPKLNLIELVAKNGERIPFEMFGSLITYEGRPAALVLLNDVRERKQLEEQRLKLEKLAAIFELAIMVGHDLRNPLQAIENAAFIIRKELSDHIYSNKRISKALQIIHDSVKYADEIVRDLRDFSIADRPNFERVNINALIKEVISQIKTPKNISVTTKLKRIPEVNADKYMMKRVFMNLIVNGIQAMEEKGGVLEVSTGKEGDFVKINFADTGVGIPESDMGKLFNSIFTTKAKGMGMGLLICKRFVESHGGVINVKSKVGEGSIFTVKLPIKRCLGGEAA
ncbi:MAG: PAS domain S-box protein [Candidatus Bathyarchaeota archaeon]|nr:PAS domain S-box protein [Candidatus Bathyarchaeota archaeon]